jgi:hypothetical protein
LKAEARRPVAGQVIPACTEAPSLVPVPPARKGERSAKAPRKTGMQPAPCFVSVRGHGWKSLKVVTERVLVNVEAGASDVLPLAIRQSFKDGQYSPSTGMEEVEWQIMMEQFIASGVVVKDEIINIDSD